MAEHSTVAFSVEPGTARTVVLVGAITGDEIAIMYTPGSPLTPDNKFVHMTKKGKPVYLTESSPIALLNLPGTYRMEIVNQISNNLHVEASDRPFPYTLMGTLDD